MVSKINKFLTLSDLDNTLQKQYRSAIEAAFPPITQHSKIIQTYWDSIEKNFPETQLFLVDPNHQLIGFFNTIPFYWDSPLVDLPDEGWDWMVKKGIQDFETNQQPNALGGLQVIITNAFLGQGFSKIIIAEGKKRLPNFGLSQLIIPIRPTFKNMFPKMEMKEYMRFKKDGKIFDPWIRTHLKGGAEIIKVCGNSMNVKGDLDFWEKLIGQKLTTSGMYQVDGALNLVQINVEKQTGEYREDNIWIYYPDF